MLPADHPLVAYAALIDTIKTEYIEDHDDVDAHPRWKRVLKALGEPGLRGLRPPRHDLAAGADLYHDNGWARWEPIGDAISTRSSTDNDRPGEPAPARR